jgi:hypothetical protein
LIGKIHKTDLNKTLKEKALLNECTLQHIKNNSHHPEYWINEDLSDFSRENPGCHDVYLMPKDAMTEMLCDWCAMSEEFGNSPFEWFAKVNSTRWNFDDNQQKFILETLHRLWKD